jgi:hypothetical protein
LLFALVNPELDKYVGIRMKLVLTDAYARALAATAASGAASPRYVLFSNATAARPQCQ